MRIAEVNIAPVKPSAGLIAFASLVINESVYLSSIAIYTRLDGSYRLLYPTKKVGDRIINFYHPVNSDTSLQIEAAIFKKCEEIFERRNNNDRYYQDTDSSSGTS
jgi:stage V sporulation protein G